MGGLLQFFLDGGLRSCSLLCLCLTVPVYHCYDFIFVYLLLGHFYAGDDILYLINQKYRTKKIDRIYGTIVYNYSVLPVPSPRQLGHCLHILYKTKYITTRHTTQKSLSIEQLENCASFWPECQYPPIDGSANFKNIFCVREKWYESNL